MGYLPKITTRTSLLSFFLLLNGFLLAQQSKDCNVDIKGRIYDYQTKEPLSFVAIQIKDTNLGTSSDEKGFFEFKNLCEKEYDLIFSRVGYQELTHHHDFHHPEMEIRLVQEGVLLEGITVEEQKSESDLNSGTSSKLSGEELKIIQSESLGDIVSNITGVSTISTGQNIAKPVIHGLHSNRVLVMNNGIRHEFQNWGIEHAPEIDPSLSNEIEVIKGAATVRFGPDALGGVILVNPAKLDLHTPIKGDLQLKGKSNGQAGEAALNLSKGFKWFSIGASGSMVKQGDLNAPDYQLTNTGKEENSYSGRIRIHPIPELDIEGCYSHFDQKLGILSGSVFGNLDDLERAIESEPPLLTNPFSYDIDQPKQEVAHDLYKANIKYITKKQAFNLQYGYQLNKRKEFGVRRGDAPNIDLELRTHSIDFDWDHPRIGPFRGKLGLQYLTQENDNLPGTNTVPFIPNYLQERMGAYLIESFEWGNNHLLEIGVRYDFQESDITGREPDNTIYRNTVVYENFSGTIGYKKEWEGGNSFRSNLGTAWRAPNVAELYRFGQHAFYLSYGLWRYTVDERFDFIVTTEGILDEEDLEVPAEQGYKWINTYEINKGKFKGELSGYVNYIENYINENPAGFTRTPRGVFIFFITEQTNALFWGADFSAEWEHNKQLSSEFKASYLWSKQIDRDDYFVGQPPASLSYHLNFKPKIKFLEQNAIKLSAHYTFEQSQHPRIISVEDFLFAFQLDLDRFSNNAKDFDIVAPPPAYFLADFFYTATWKKLDFQFQVKNIFDTSYRNYTDRLRYFADALGRNFIVGLGYRF